MRVARFAHLLTATLAIMALPAPALACATPAAGGGGGSHRSSAKAPAKAPVKRAKPVNKPKPAKPAMESECCTPDAAAIKPLPQAEACCEEGMKPGAKGAAAECCAEGMKAGAKPGAACCEAGAKAQAAKPMAVAKGDAPCCDHPAPDGSCCSPDKPHGAPGTGMREGVRIERRYERGGRWGHHGGMMRGAVVKGAEVRYMPALAGGNQYIVLARGSSLQANPWLSLGHQMNWALQLGNGPNAGPWFTPYGGFVGRLGAQLGPIRGDLGALVGLGGMLRTGQVLGATGPVNDVLQARAMWVVEPRVELGWRGEHLGLGLVGAYNFNPNMADFGGPSVGLKMTWRRPGWM
jgi:hypothetical protein